jgi:hypothetical protein
LGTLFAEKDEERDEFCGKCFEKEGEKNGQITL